MNKKLVLFSKLKEYEKDNESHKIEIEKQKNYYEKKIRDTELKLNLAELDVLALKKETPFEDVEL